MATLLPRTRALLFAGRGATLGAILTIAVACAAPNPTDPTWPATVLSTARVAGGAAMSNGQGPQACVPDAKLLGRFTASTADAPGTWWRLTKDRFDALGVTDYKAALEAFYGQSFPTLAAAIQYLIDGVASYDTNGNGYVCAFEVNGTRAYLGINALYLLGIADDKHVDD